MSNRPEVHYYEWEGGDGAGTVFDLDEVYEVFRYARENDLSVGELFALFTFPDRSVVAPRRYELPPGVRELTVDDIKAGRVQVARYTANPLFTCPALTEIPDSVDLRDVAAGIEALLTSELPDPDGSMRRLADELAERLGQPVDPR